MPKQPMSPDAITSITELTASQGETRFDQHYSRDDIRNHTVVVGRWFDRGTLEFDLKGDVRREDFLALIHGFNPKDLTALNALEHVTLLRMSTFSRLQNQ